MTTTAQKAFTSHLHPEPSWNRDDHAEPTGREETWRFTPIRRFRPLTRMASAATLSPVVSEARGVSIRTVNADQAREISSDAPVDIVAANAIAYADAVTVVDIAAETVLDEPLMIDLAGVDEPSAAHLIITIGHHATGTIVVRHTGEGTLASKVEVYAADEAQISFVSLQDWDAGSLQGSQMSYTLGRNTHLRTVQASIGAGDVRIVERVNYEGTGGHLEQLGMYFVRADQHVEHRLLVDHDEPNTVSNVDYRGALQGKGAHSVWIGDVMIRSTAENIDTYESNRNLMLTSGCQADSVPNLEIETGEILGAGHASSTGRFDDDQLFYLRSRGIPEEQARRLIVEGFFLDLIRKIEIPEIEERLTQALVAQLDSVQGIHSGSMLSGEDA